MRIGNIKNISFQKKLVASCAVLNGATSEECSIYKLDSFEDRDYFDNLAKLQKWQLSYFLSGMADKIRDDAPYTKRSIYAIENSKNECLGYCRVDDTYNNISYLTHLEVVPYASHRNEARKSKYVGETLVAFLAKMAKKNNKKSIYVPNMYMPAMNFYLEKCKFLTCDFINFSSSELTSDRFEALEKQNFKHTGQNISIIE